MVLAVSARDKLLIAMAKLQARFPPPKGFLEQIGYEQGEKKIKELIRNMTEAQAEEIRREMWLTLC